MKENVIVSFADSNYFDLLNELVNSIKSFLSEVKTVNGKIIKKNLRFVE